MTPGEHEASIEAFVAAIRSSRKYRHVCEDTVRDVMRESLRRHTRRADAARAARARLHGIHAAYLGRQVILEHLDAIRDAHRTGDLGRLRAICARLMRDHASTRERIPVLDRFYREIFAVTGVPRTILDIACGLHPLGIPWMPLSPGARYHGYEIAGDVVATLNEFLRAIGREPLIRVRDVVCTPASEKGDLAFLLKTVPCMERRRKGAAVRVIRDLRVRHVVVSFPVRGLSGRSKRMREFNRSRFTRMVAGSGWGVIEVPLAEELVFVVDKGE